MNTEEMTYSQSAQGVMISAARVVQELKSHGFTGEAGYQALASFMEDAGLEPPDDRNADWVDAGELMDFLGY